MADVVHLHSIRALGTTVIDGMCWAKEAIASATCTASAERPVVTAGRGLRRRAPTTPRTSGDAGRWLDLCAGPGGKTALQFCQNGVCVGTHSVDACLDDFECYKVRVTRSTPP